MNSAVGRAKDFLKKGTFYYDPKTIIEELLAEIDFLRGQDTRLRGKIREKAEEIHEASFAVFTPEPQLKKIYYDLYKIANLTDEG